MYISIYRKSTNSLYTEGKLIINGKLETYTLEPSDVMLPEGEYQMQIVKLSPRKQTLSIMDSKGLPTKWKIGLAHSFLDAKKETVIAIGRPLIPGSVYQGSKHLERLTDRITKCIGRGEPVVVNIYDTLCTPQRLSPHWLAPQQHGCPPSTIHVEEADDSTLHIYDGDKLIQTVENKGESEACE